MYRRISKTFRIGRAFMLLLLIGVSLSFGLDYREGINPKGLREAYRLNPYAIQHSPVFPRTLSGTRGIEEAVWFKPVITGFSVAYSPDGKLIASTGGFGTVLLFNASDGSLVRALTGHTGWVRSVAFSRDGTLLASGSADKTIKIWNVSDGSCIKTLTGHTDWVNSVAFSPDGKLLASGSADKTIKIWNVSDGSCIKTLTGHTDVVSSVAFSPDGKLLASGSGDCTIKIWNVSDGSCIKTLTGHTDWVNSVAFSPDGKLLASGSVDCTIKIWNVSDGSCIKTLTGYTYQVEAVSFSPDGKLLASGSLDYRITIWNVSDGSCIKTLTSHTNIVFSVAFSPDGKLLASGSYDKTIKIWNVSDGFCIKTLTTGHTYVVSSVAFSPDGKLLASGSYDETIKIWNVSDGSCIKILTGHSHFVNSVAFSPDGKLLASGSYDKTIKIWNVSDGSCIKTLTGHTDAVSSVAFSPDGKLLASGSWDVIKIWNVSDGSCIKTLTDHTYGVLWIAFSPDGKLLASGSDDNTIRIWRVSDGSCIKILTGHSHFVNSVAFSPDGKLLASGSADNTIRIWRVSDSSCIKTLTGHTSGVLFVAFSPDGKLLASGSDDTTIKIWSVADGSCIKTLTGHTGWVESVAFSPDGWLLASGGDDGIAVWSVSGGGNVKLSKSVDKESALIGDELTYTLTYENHSNQTLKNISITDKIPITTNYLSGSATGGGSFDSNSKTLTWKIATLNPGQEGSVSFKVKTVSGTEISNKATLSAPSYSIESNTVKTTISSSLKLPWSFAIITDIHMGRNIYSSREEGGLKEIPLPNYLVDRLTKALENIKKLKDKENIQFVVVLGDISDSGEEGELKKAKEILDKFQGESGIPYIPLLGNHDLWAYCDDNGILHPADRNISYFPGVFKNQFEALKGMLQEFKLEDDFDHFLDSIQEGQPASLLNHYVNFSFKCGGIKFIALDFNSREFFSKVSGKGDGPDAVLNDKTKDWLSKSINENEPTIILSHHPLLINPFNAFGAAEIPELHKIFDNKKVLANFAGHIHSFDHSIYEVQGYLAPDNANIIYHPDKILNPFNFKVVITEALMVGSNAKGAARKGVTRIVKIDNSVFEKIDIPDANLDRWETSSEFKDCKLQELKAINPSFTYEKINNPWLLGLGYVSNCFSFSADTFTELEINRNDSKSFTWLFSDGTTMDGKDIIKTFSSAGKYKVTLKVKGTEKKKGSPIYEESITQNVEAVGLGILSEILINKQSSSLPQLPTLRITRGSQ